MLEPYLMKIVRPCWWPSSNAANNDRSSSDDDALLWFKDLGRHVAGEFSMAVVQANKFVEDASQIESGSLNLDPASKSNLCCGTFVGVYDGHGGPETSRYINHNLIPNLKKIASEEQSMSPEVIKRAYKETEEGFLSVVRKRWLELPRLASVGSCCMVGVICGEMLYVANAGDSRAVLGRWAKGERDVSAVQMTMEHNASHDNVREELRSLHPDDPEIVVFKNKVWRVKGIIQISRSIGDAYLKDAEFNREPLIPRFRLPEPFHKSILSAEPSIVTHKLSPEDQFLIFASDGLWEHLSNHEVVDIVHNSPRNGIARRLIEAALKEAARKREIRYCDLQKLDRGIRRHFHDDITVVVLYIDSGLICKMNYNGPMVSLRGGGPSADSSII